MVVLSQFSYTLYLASSVSMRQLNEKERPTSVHLVIPCRVHKNIYT